MNFWDERYRVEEYVYGTKPNEFFRESIRSVNGSRTILFPGEGEGRNAVYAARLGYRVTAIDLSEQARLKALKLANANNVSIDYRVGDFIETDFPENSFDVVAIIFVHIPAEQRKEFLRKAGNCLKLGGIVIMEVYNKKQLIHQRDNPNAGGPRKKEMLYDIREIRDAYSDFLEILLEEKDVRINEGIFHQGMASVIRFIGKKSA